MWEWIKGQPRKVLPEATGPYIPGCIDVMTEYSKDGLFMRLYYPTNVDRSEVLENRYPPWIPSRDYIDGIGSLLKIGAFLVKLAFWYTGNLNMRVPAIWGEKPKTDTKLKCIILSHGLGGFRNLYTHFCCELASRGFLAVALEHRDGSGAYTYYYQSKEDARRKRRTPVIHEHCDVRPDIHYRERNRFAHLKAAECERALDFLLNLNEGVVPYNVLNDVPSQYKPTFKLEDLIGNLDVDSVTMVGHSFGAASALLALSRRPELKQGVLLDGWMFPIKDEELDTKIDQPLLFVNTETFHVEANVNKMERFLTGEHREMYTIFYTTHEHQTDSILLIGSYLNWFMPKLNPIQALKINHYLVLTFLHKYVDFPANILDCERLLNDESENIEKGLTTPWA